MGNKATAPRRNLSNMLARIVRWGGNDTAPAKESDDIPAAVEDLHVQASADLHMHAPTAAAIHLLLDEGLVHLEDGRLVIASADGARRHLLMATIAQLSLHGRAGVTSPAIRKLMAEGIPLLWRDEAGRIVGMACDLTLRATETRRAQFAAQVDPARKLAVASALVSAKIAATRGMLRRRGAPASLLTRLDGLGAGADSASSLPTLLGIEGAAADAAFGHWPQLIAPDSGFAFIGRRRRPPPDPVNAMLSYAYAILVGEAFAAALAAGLDPHAGFLHAERAGRPALALDLMEPLRPLVADRAVLSIINRGEVKPQDFVESPADGVRLSPKARKALLSAIEDRLNWVAPGSEGTAAMNVRQAMGEEAMALARALKRGEPFASRFGRR